MGISGGGQAAHDAQGPERATVPLQSRANASPFWIMFLLSSGTFEREIIEVKRRDPSSLRSPSPHPRRLATTRPASPPIANPKVEIADGEQKARA